MTQLPSLLLLDIEAGKTDSAISTLALITEQAHTPDVCTKEMLAALRKARTLALVQRSHIVSRLRSLEASSLYRASEPSSSTWQIDG